MGLRWDVNLVREGSFGIWIAETQVRVVQYRGSPMVHPAMTVLHAPRAFPGSVEATQPKAASAARTPNVS